MTPFFYYSLNKHKLKGKLQKCLFPSDNVYTRELSTNFSFRFNYTNSKWPASEHSYQWEGSRVSGLPEDAGSWERQWQMSEGEQAAAQVPLCPCCWGWHLLLSCRWPGPAALGAAALWVPVLVRGLRAAAVPTPGDSQDQFHKQEQPLPWEAGVSLKSQDLSLTPTARLVLKFKAICSNPPILL